MVEIKDIEKRSLAERQGVLAGDILLSINGHEITDVLDYRFYLAEKSVTLKLHRGPELVDITIQKGEYDDIGLEFETYLMDKKQFCRNKCVFCFIDQLPKGMRETLYFKDDDARLSFLQGNYITMTNMTEHEIDRIIEMHISPVNISVHATNPELRVKMMKNPRAANLMPIMRRFAEAGIKMNCQLVLCKGLNDGDELLRSMRELGELYPMVESVSAVPAGLTCHREGLYPLEAHTKEDCQAILSAVNAFGDAFYETHGTRLIYCADELYVKAGQPIPDASYYESYPQIENGVGLMRSMEDEFEDELSYLAEDYDLSVPRSVSVVTGMAASEYITKLANKLMEKAPALQIRVYPIVNHFFGKSITVAGLLCGCDIKEQLLGKELGDKVIIPAVTLRAGRDLFLDGMTPDELASAIGTAVQPCENGGAELIAAVLG